MHVQTVRRQQGRTLLGPFDSHNPSSVEVVRQADMLELALRFKTVQIGVRQRLPASIFVDKHERWAADQVSGNAQPFRKASDQCGLARSQLPEKRHHLTASQALSDHAPESSRCAR